MHSMFSIFSMFFKTKNSFQKLYVWFMFLKTVIENSFKKHIKHENCFCSLDLIFYVFFLIVKNWKPNMYFLFSLFFLFFIIKKSFQKL